MNRNDESPNVDLHRPAVAVAVTAVAVAVTAVVAVAVAAVAVTALAVGSAAPRRSCSRTPKTYPRH